MDTQSHLDLIRKPIATSTWIWGGVGIVLTFGVLLPVLAGMFALAWIFDDPPTSFDRDGLRTRRRRCIRWADVAEAHGHTEYVRRGGQQIPVRWYVRIRAKQGTRIHFQPDLFRNGGEALDFLERALATTFHRPA